MSAINTLPRLHYDLSSYDDWKSSGYDLGGLYLTFRAHDSSGNSVEFSTNGAGEGLFIWSDSLGYYRQTMGTCQYSIRGRSKRWLRKELRERFIRVHGDKYGVRYYE